MINVTRTIHPVGQGLFCTEKFCNEEQQPVLSVAYDCGSFNRRALSSQILDLPIDVIFISHFHYDHICGIPDLIKKNRNIKVVMPQLSQELLVEAIVYNYVHTIEIEDITDVPEINRMLVKWYFHTESEENLCIVEPFDINKELSSKDITSLPKSISNASIRYKAIWEYVPFLYFDYQFANNLLKVLQNDTNFGSYFSSINEENINKFITDISSNTSLLTKLNDIYMCCAEDNRLCNANEYSMPVYSGPIVGEEVFVRVCHSHCHAPHHPHCYMCCDIDCCVPDSVCGSLANCLYTGDFNANPTKPYYQGMVAFYHFIHRWERIRMVQVPHHGSEYNHNIDLYQRRCWAFISCGLRNRYHHPHGTCVADIFNTRCHCSIVNEHCQPLMIDIFIH